MSNLGSAVPLAAENGIPKCPWDGEPMIEVEPNLWQCPMGKAMQDAVTRALVASLEARLEELEA